MVNGVKKLMKYTIDGVPLLIYLSLMGVSIYKLIKILKAN